MKYSKAIDGAMKWAKKYGETMIVFGVKKRWWFGYDYRWGDVMSFNVCLKHLKRPVIKFMTITANGRCV